MSQATCEILTFTLGPFQFEVLGIVINIDPVTVGLNADALSGFVGRWLCALAEAWWLDLLRAPMNGLLGL